MDKMDNIHENMESELEVADGDVEKLQTMKGLNNVISNF